MNLLDILWGTPYWVWGIFVYLLISGIEATKSKNVFLWQLSIMPFIFIIWSIYSLINKCSNCFQLLGFWLAPFSLGILIGYRMLYKAKLNIDPNTKLIHLPGSFTPLIFSLVFFIGKYILGVTYALNPLLKGNLIVVGLDLILSGLISGISLGRFTQVFQAYRSKMIHK